MPTLNQYKDLSNGWESIANVFVANRTSKTGAATIENWSKSFKPEQAVLDVGCGFGGPYTQDLIDKGINVYGIDASKTLIQEYQKRFPGVLAKCEAAETSLFFDKKFDGVISVGLIFLLSQKVQIAILKKMAVALNEGGKLLFSSPYQICSWDDLLTGRKSISLGRDTYINVLRQKRLTLIDEHTDEGENHYYDFQKKNAL